MCYLNKTGLPCFFIRFIWDFTCFHYLVRTSLQGQYVFSYILLKCNNYVRKVALYFFFNQPLTFAIHEMHLKFSWDSSWSAGRLECVNMSHMQIVLDIFKCFVLTLTEMYMQIHAATFITPHLGSWCTHSCVWPAGRLAHSLHSHTAGWGNGPGCQDPNGNYSTHKLTGGMAPVWGEGWEKRTKWRICEEKGKETERQCEENQLGDWNMIMRGGN